MAGPLTENYDQDFYSWAMENARLMRNGRLGEIDVEHIAEELESMGRSERRQLVDHLTVLLAYLLQWTYQPSLRCNSWKYTIKEQRRRVRDLLEDSPSLKADLETRFSRAYEDARLLAAKETGMEEAAFPEECPFGFSEAMDEEYLPGDGR